MDFYKRIKRLVKASKYASLQEFILSVGINYNSYYSLTQSGNLPRADEAVAIAAALGVSVEYLVTGEPSEADKAFDKIRAVLDGYQKKAKQSK